MSNIYHDSNGMYPSDPRYYIPRYGDPHPLFDELYRRHGIDVRGIQSEKDILNHENKALKCDLTVARAKLLELTQKTEKEGPRKRDKITSRKLLLI
jgi:hypothetical protein